MARVLAAKIVNRVLSKAGYEPKRSEIADLDPQTLSTIDAVAPYTMTSPERIFASCEAARYVTRFGIPGSVVECGVWAGGSMMAIARTLMEQGDTSRDLCLFDTFDGMSAPTELDTDIHGEVAGELMATQDHDTAPVWAYASLEDVRKNIESTGYPMERVHFVKGPVEETVPGQAPDSIALLRLDTDWYESTRHELEHLPGRVSVNGVLIIDDYGHWQGARKAVDEWLAVSARPVLLSRTDYTGRIAILPA
jgi:hypothetical protein